MLSPPARAPSWRFPEPSPHEAAPPLLIAASSSPSVPSRSPRPSGHPSCSAPGSSCLPAAAINSPLRSSSEASCFSILSLSELLLQLQGLVPRHGKLAALPQALLLGFGELLLQACDVLLDVQKLLFKLLHPPLRLLRRSPVAIPLGLRMRQGLGNKNSGPCTAACASASSSSIPCDRLNCWKC